MGYDGDIIKGRPIVSEFCARFRPFCGSICGLKGAVETSTNGASRIHYCGTQATQLSLFALGQVVNYEQLIPQYGKRHTSGFLSEEPTAYSAEGSVVMARIWHNRSREFLDYMDFSNSFRNGAGVGSGNKHYKVQHCTSSLSRRMGNKRFRLGNLE